MARRIAACLALAAFLWIEWRDVVAPMMASRHHVPGAPLGTLGLMLLPVAGILTSLWLLFGGGLRSLLEDSRGERRPAWHLLLAAALAVGAAAAAVTLSHRDRGEAGFGAREAIDFPLATTVQFTPDRITFTPEGGALHAMVWTELASIGLVGGSKDFKPGSLETSWQFTDLNSVHYSVPQAALAEHALVDAVRARFGDRAQDRPVARFEAEMRLPDNVTALAKGYAGVSTWVWLR